jgi:hypothetical protein
MVVDRLKDIEKNLKTEQKLDDPILGTEDVMRLLKVSRRTLQSWRDEGVIEFSAVRGKFYYRLSSVNAMLDNNKVEAYHG